MIKTQIQIPEDLYKELKGLAKRKEWSLAETLRRGGEYLLEIYPAEAPADSTQWKPPASRHVGWKGLTAEEIHELAVEDMEPRLP